jgi:hypothetical protein
MPFQPIAFPAARVVEKLAARRDRDIQRGRRAREDALQAGAAADDAAVAAIRATFDRHHEINALKLAVEWAIRRGTGDPLVRARYGKRAERLHFSNIDKAITRVERWYSVERRTWAFGRTRLSYEVLREVRLILRLIRRSRYRDDYAGIVQLVIGKG